MGFAYQRTLRTALQPQVAGCREGARRPLTARGSHATDL